MKKITIVKSALASAVAFVSAFSLQAQDKFIVSGGVGFLDEYVWRGLEIQDDVVKPEATVTYLASDSLTISANVAGFLATDTNDFEQEDEWNFTIAGSFKPQNWWLSISGGVTYYYLTFDVPAGFDDNDDYVEPFVGANISINELFGEAGDGILVDGDALVLGSFVYFEFGDFREGETFEQILTYTLPIESVNFIDSTSLISRWGYRDVEVDLGGPTNFSYDYIYYGLMVELDLPLSEIVGVIPEGISLKPNIRYDSSEDKDDAFINSGDTFRNVTWGVSIVGTW